MKCVLEFSQTVAERKRVAVIGESRGSYIAQGLAHSAPDLIAGLCLIVPGEFPTDPSPPKPAVQTIVARPDLLEGLPPPLSGRAEYLVVQSAEIIDKIRETKISAA